MSARISACSSASSPTASMACVPLISEMVFFGFQHERLDPARFKASALATHALVRRMASPSPISASAKMRQRRQIAAGSHAALRWNHRMHAAVQHLAERVDHHGPRTPE